MAKLKFRNTNEEVEVGEGEAIAQHCEEQGVPFACTDGICGTCIVEIEAGMGELSDPTEREVDFLGMTGVGRERMCCQCRIREGASGTVVIVH